MFKIFKKYKVPSVINKVDFLIEYSKKDDLTLPDYELFWKEVTLLKNKHKVSISVKTIYNKNMPHVKITHTISLTNRELLSKGVMLFFTEVSDILDRLKK